MSLQQQEDILAEVKNLSLRSRLIADSAIAGLHRSKNHGSSVEFAEHKEYTPGDDLRHLDWKALARHDKYYIKKFEDEVILRVVILLDISGTMNYPVDAQDRLSKIELSKTFAGALSYILFRQGDSTNIATFAEHLNYDPQSSSRKKSLSDIFTTLESIEPSTKTNLEEALSELTSKLTQRSVVIIFSDLLDGGLNALKKLNELRARHHDVAVFHVLDKDELEFPFEESLFFDSLEEDFQLKVDAHEIKHSYFEEIKNFCKTAKDTCTENHSDYFLLRSDQSPTEQLTAFLSRRNRLKSRLR